jgi:putative transcriptional regulator
MNNDTFTELISSVQEGADILRGRRLPSREFDITFQDVKAIRERLGLSQHQFAALLGVSIDTLQNWEQNRRKPRGAARTLLLIAAKHPEIVLDVLQSS